jgi:hypothetical protein
MDVQRLALLLEQPQIHQRLVGGFNRPYTLGLGTDPEEPSRHALILRVEGDEAPDVPSQIELGGEAVKVVTRTRLKPIKPLGVQR